MFPRLTIPAPAPYLVLHPKVTLSGSYRTCLGSGNVDSLFAEGFEAPFSPILPLVECLLRKPLLPILFMPFDTLAARGETFLMKPLPLPWLMPFCWPLLAPLNKEPFVLELAKPFGGLVSPFNILPFEFPASLVPLAEPERLLIPLTLAPPTAC